MGRTSSFMLTTAGSSQTPTGASVRVSAGAVRPSADTATVVGEILEILPGYGLVHLRTPSGAIYGLNRKTPGISFEGLRVGQHLRCHVTNKFSRVLSAEALD